MKLKDTYPLYLNNKPVQPNTDLAVTDKFTGEVAFRTALATPEIIDEAIAGAVRAAEPMARLASYERQAVLDYCVQRFRERNLYFGGVQAVARDPATGALSGAGDPRRGGAVVAA